MPTNVLLPQWGMNMQDGTLVRWLKREQEAVEKGEPLAEIETAKINSELEAPASGVLAHIAVPEGATVDVGALLAIIAAPGEEVVPPPASVQATYASTPPSTLAAQSTPPRPTGPSIQVVPAARRLARQLGIDLNRVRGSGPSGRILEADVQAAVAALVQPAGEVVPLIGVRKVIAERMLESVRTMAQVTLTTEADVTEAVRLRRNLVSRWRPQGTRPVALALPIKATARALAENPHLNAVLLNGELHLLKEVNVGFAVALQEGLIVPVVRNADDKSLLDINMEVLDLATRAIRSQLSPEEVAGATFTITDLRAFDIDAFTPIIDPPQMAILGVGRVLEKPVVYQGEVSKRSMMALSLTFDHRATDGAPAGRLLQAIKGYLEVPDWLAQ